VGTQYRAAYTNLAPGHYTLRVKGSNADGVWNEKGATLALVILPPVWQTWWFRALEGVAAAGALFALFRFQQRRRLEVALSQQALRDSLTGLANRALFRDRVAHALARLAREAPVAGEPQRVAVLFVDLDGFKAVNDRFGHHDGDRLLQGVAARLLNATRGSDTVARFGGDEFAVLLENARGPADALTVAERVVTALGAPIALGDRGDRSAGREARVGASVGVAFAESGVDADTLLRRADAAMYQAKTEGKGRVSMFHPALAAATDERLALEADLAGALERGELTLAYQPIVAMETGAARGVEALLRWHHPTRGPVPPARFVPIAESCGLIGPLGRWVLDEACRSAAAWPAPAGEPLGVAVNVSGRQLDDPSFPSYVAAALAESGLAPERLTLEITESALMRDTDAALATLGALKTLGVRLAVDDFGTGYCSLRYLQRFPIDVLKIDKSFVDGIAHDAHDAALARTIVSLAEQLHLHTVAEGIEHPEQRERLRAMGCEVGQGYLFARPLDGAALRAWLAQTAREVATAS
jgi:diguanylate cyclase (GGDEF)-like protein